MYKNIINKTKERNLEIANSCREELLQKIKSEIAAKRRRLIFKRAVGSVAVAGVVVIFLLLSINKNSSKISELATVNHISLANVDFDMSNYIKGKISVYNGDDHFVIDNKSTLKDIGDNRLLLSSGDTLSLCSDITRVMVPASTRAGVILSDGTYVAMNANSYLTFSQFSAETREVDVVGELYFKVAKDNERRFIAHTKEFNVAVYGTEFNICSFAHESSSNVVLVEGSVSVDIDGDILKMVPGNLVEVEGERCEKRDVDVEKYVSWLDNIMIFDKEPLSVVANRVANYYGVDIEVDNSCKDVQISGKLEINDNYKKVVRVLGKISETKIVFNGDKAILTK